MQDASLPQPSLAVVEQYPAHAAPQQPGSYPSPSPAANAAPAPAQALLWHQLPQELRERRQWLLAGPNERGELKVPKSLDAAGHVCAGSSTNVGTWLTFEQARDGAIRHGLGVGYCLHDVDPFFCLDLDVKNAHNAPDKPDLWTTPEHIKVYEGIINEFDTYTERSRSGQGWHVWGHGKIGEGIKRAGVELYSQERFIVCTGDVVRDMPIEERQALVSEYAAVMRSGAAGAPEPLESRPQVEDDAVIWQRAERAANGEKFAALRAGQWQTLGYPSASEADLALIASLGFYSSNDEQVERMFYTTPLGQRDKHVADGKGRLFRYALRVVRRRMAREAAELARVRIARWEQIKAVGDGTLAPTPTPVLSLDQMVKGFVFIRAKSNVALLDRPSAFGPFSDMRNDYAASVTTKVDPETGKPKKYKTIDLWLQAEERLRADTLTFDPRYGQFCASPDGQYALNLYRPTSHEAPEGWQELAAPFVNHVAWLVQDPAERERFFNWLAHIEQKPGELPHYGYIMVALVQGVGRNWMAAMLALVWRGHVALDFDLRQTLTSGFNGRLSRKFLAVVDEINEGKQSDQWPHAEKLKAMVTTTERYINPKFGFEYAEVNCCRWLLFSNHTSAIPLGDADRRWQVIRNPGEPGPGWYYEGLYKRLDSPQFIAAVREWLRRRDLSAFNPGERPTMNDAKREMVEAARSADAERAADLVATWPADVITVPELAHELYGDEDQRSGRTKHRAAEAKMVRWRGPQGTSDARLRVPGYPNPVRVWVLRNHERWAHADCGAILAELGRARRP